MPKRTTEAERRFRKFIKAINQARTDRERAEAGYELLESYHAFGSLTQSICVAGILDRMYRPAETVQTEYPKAGNEWQSVQGQGQR